MRHELSLTLHQTKVDFCVYLKDFSWSWFHSILIISWHVLTPGRKRLSWWGGYVNKAWAFSTPPPTPRLKTWEWNLVFSSEFWVILWSKSWVPIHGNIFWILGRQNKKVDVNVWLCDNALLLIWRVLAAGQDSHQFYRKYSNPVYPKIGRSNSWQMWQSNSIWIGIGGWGPGITPK